MLVCCIGGRSADMNAEGNKALHTNPKRERPTGASPNRKQGFAY